MEAVFPRLTDLMMEALITLCKAEVKLKISDKVLLRQRWNDFQKNKGSDGAHASALVLCQCCEHLLDNYGFTRQSAILRSVLHEFSKVGMDMAINEVGAIAHHHRSVTPHMSNDTIFANLFELSEDQIWVREFPRLYTKWMQIAHTAYHDNETAANMFFYFALSTSSTEAEYAHWFVSTGPNTYHDDVAKIAALKQHFAATPHGNVTHDQMIFVQRLYEKAAHLTFYFAKTEDLCVHVKNMMKKSTESLSRSI